MKSENHQKEQATDVASNNLPLIKRLPNPMPVQYWLRNEFDAFFSFLKVSRPYRREAKKLDHYEVCMSKDHLISAECPVMMEICHAAKSMDELCRAMVVLNALSDFS